MIRNHDLVHPAVLKHFVLKCYTGRTCRVVKTTQYSLYWASKRAKDLYPKASVIKVVSVKPTKNRRVTC